MAALSTIRSTWTMFTVLYYFSWIVEKNVYQGNYAFLLYLFWLLSPVDKMILSCCFYCYLFYVGFLKHSAKSYILDFGTRRWFGGKKYLRVW